MKGGPLSKDPPRGPGTAVGSRPRGAKRDGQQDDAGRTGSKGQARTARNKSQGGETRAETRTETSQETRAERPGQRPEQRPRRRPGSLDGGL